MTTWGIIVYMIHFFWCVVVNGDITLDVSITQTIIISMWSKLRGKVNISNIQKDFQQVTK